MSEIDDSIRGMDQEEQQRARREAEWWASGFTPSDSPVDLVPAHLRSVVDDFVNRDIDWSRGLVGRDPDGVERLMRGLVAPMDPRKQPGWRNLRRGDRKSSLAAYRNQVDRFEILKSRLQPIGYIDFGHGEYDSDAKSERFVIDFSILADGRTTSQSALRDHSVESLAQRFAQYLRNRR